MGCRYAQAAGKACPATLLGIGIPRRWEAMRCIIISATGGAASSRSSTVTSTHTATVVDAGRRWRPSYHHTKPPQYHEKTRHSHRQPACSSGFSRLRSRGGSGDHRWRCRQMEARSVWLVSRERVGQKRVSALAHRLLEISTGRTVREWWQIPSARSPCHPHPARPAEWQSRPRVKRHQFCRTTKVTHRVPTKNHEYANQHPPGLC
jgi:hypothetical protein